MTQVAVITPASASRRDHLERQRRMLPAGIVRVEAWLDATPDAVPPGTIGVHVPPGRHGVRVGAARNAAAAAAVAAGADLLVFLDVDCLPAPDLVDRYREASHRHPEELLAGAVTYLASPQRPSASDELAAMRRPHRARPAPADGETQLATDAEYDLFWSLSFAVTPAVWTGLGGFDPRYEGYGAEDTDLARRARAGGVPLRWVGGAHAFHQWHPVSSPPWQHLDDILRNGAAFADRWGEWPMTGWLEAFAAAGAIQEHAGGWRRIR
ncbi:galactosyltransferase-related protein [Microbacterium sp. NPDC091313]